MLWMVMRKVRMRCAVHTQRLAIDKPGNDKAGHTGRQITS